MNPNLNPAAFAQPERPRNPNPVISPASGLPNQQSVLANQQLRIQMLQQSFQQTPRPGIPLTPGSQNLNPQQLRQLQMQRMMQIQQLSARGMQAPSQMTPIQMQQQFSQVASTPGSAVRPRGFITPARPMVHPPKRGIVLQNTASMPGSTKHHLLPPVNTYVPRLKLGSTALMVPLVKNEKRKKSRFAEDQSEQEEEYDDESFTDSEDEEGGVRRSSRNVVRSTSQQIEQPTSEQTTEYVPPLFEIQKRRRLLSTTKHDFEKINLYRLPQFSTQKEVLVPIRIELEVNGFKISDAFSWNLNERMLSIDKFAEYLCDDLELNAQTYVPIIGRSIRSQLDEHKKFFQISDIPVPEDTRVLDIKVGKVHLRDKFEWDLCSTITPEEFAIKLASDLSLGGEFVSLISHSIREQIFRARQIGEYEPTFAIEKPFRSEEEARGWSPFVDCGDTEDMDEELGLEQDRKQRLLRRQQRLNENMKKRGAYSAYDVSLLNQPVGLAMTVPQIQSIPLETRKKWRCLHCLCPISKTNDVLNGPAGELTLCKACGTYYQNENLLPEHRLGLFK